MKFFKQLIRFTLIATTFAIFSTLASCSSNINPEDYDAVEKEIIRPWGFFEDWSSRVDREEMLIYNGTAIAESKKDYDLVRQYYMLYTNAGWTRDQYEKNVLEFYLNENQHTYAKSIVTISHGLDDSEKASFRDKIEKSEMTYLISLKSEEAANRLISMLERPKKKPNIGEECEAREINDKQHSFIPVAAYHHCVIAFNSRLDEYLSIALEQQNDIAAKKILAQYVEIAKYKTYIKKEKKHEYEYKQVIGFSNQPREDAIKRYKEAKEFWRSLEN